MIIPATYNVALLLIILSMICWGSWANTFKMAGKWRFELFYYDYSLGVLLAAIVAAYTFGSMGSDLSPIGVVDYQLIAIVSKDLFESCVRCEVDRLSDPVG